MVWVSALVSDACWDARHTNRNVCKPWLGRFYALLIVVGSGHSHYIILTIKSENSKKKHDHRKRGSNGGWGGPERLKSWWNISFDLRPMIE